MSFLTNVAAALASGNRGSASTMMLMTSIERRRASLSRAPLTPRMTPFVNIGTPRSPSIDITLSVAPIPTRSVSDVSSYSMVGSSIPLFPDKPSFENASTRIPILILEPFDQSYNAHTMS